MDEEDEVSEIENYFERILRPSRIKELKKMLYEPTIVCQLLPCINKNESCKSK